MSATSHNRGFAAIMAVFIVVVLAALGVFIVTIFSAEQRTSTFDVQSARAFQSARAGIEFGVYQALHNTSCPASTTFALPGALSAFSVTVQCNSPGGGAEVHTEGATTINMYYITATACNNPGPTCPGAATPTYVERQLRATVGTNP